MSKTTDFTKIVNLDDFTQDVSRIEDLSDRVRLAGYALAAPLVDARAAQMEREVARTAKRKGANHPEVALRQANAERSQARFTLFAEELDRVRISRPEFDAEKGSAIWGRVVDDGVPQPELSVSAIGAGLRLDFDCTDELGSFSLDLPANTALLLSVKNKDGAELYRDPESAELELGQQQYREIDLTRGAQTPCPEPGPDVPPDDTFKMLDLVGRTEAAALSLLANQGLIRGDRSTEQVEDMVGRVLSHIPEAGATVKRGDSINIVIGVSSQVQVPDLIGLTLEQAQALLKKAGLQDGELSQQPVTNERAGLIVKQNPLPGTLADLGSPVKMVIGVARNGEPDPVTVPDMTGISVDEAEARLKQAQLRRGQTSEVSVPPEKVGLVVGQSPGAGATVPPDTVVALVVGKTATDDSNIRVPDVRGKSRDEAEEIIKKAKLKTGDLSEKPTDRVPPGAVLDQSPPPDSLVAKGDAINLVIGTRLTDDVRRTRVPQVTGITFDKAAALLKNKGFGSERTERRVTAPAQQDIVLEQNPRADNTAVTGTTARLVVGILAQKPKSPKIRHSELDKIAEITQTDLIKRKVLPADEPRGAFLQRLNKSGVKTIADVDKLLSLDRRELRDLLGLRTLAQTNQTARALRRARKQVGD